MTIIMSVMCTVWHIAICTANEQMMCVAVAYMCRCYQTTHPSDVRHVECGWTDPYTPFFEDQRQKNKHPQKKKHFVFLRHTRMWVTNVEAKKHCHTKQHSHMQCPPTTYQHEITTATSTTHKTNHTTLYHIT
jgi:hypothetical protein